MELEDVHLRVRANPRIVDGEVFAQAALFAHAHASDLLSPAAAGVLLEETFAADTVRTSHHRQRTPGDLRQQDIGDRLV